MKLYKKWTKDEIDELKKLYVIDGLTHTEISGIMDRTMPGISKKCKKLKLRHTDIQKQSAYSRSNSGKNNGMFGKKGWSTGLTKKSSGSLLSMSKKQSIKVKHEYDNGIRNTAGKNNGMYGKSPWCKGLTKDTSDILKNSGDKISSIKKIQWQALPEKEKEKRRIQWGNAGLKCPKKLTSIEIKIQKFLESKCVKFEQNYPIGRFLVDFYIVSKNLVIECQGDYWHVNPLKYNGKNLSAAQISNIKRDINKVKYLNENKIKSIFLWENDIHNKFSEVKLKLEDAIN